MFAQIAKTHIEMSISKLNCSREARENNFQLPLEIYARSMRKRVHANAQAKRKEIISKLNSNIDCQANRESYFCKLKPRHGTSSLKLTPLCQAKPRRAEQSHAKPSPAKVALAEPSQALGSLPCHPAWEDLACEYCCFNKPKLKSRKR